MDPVEDFSAVEYTFFTNTTSQLINSLPALRETNKRVIGGYTVIRKNGFAIAGAPHC